MLIPFMTFPSDTLTVGVKLSPPFIIKYDNGHYGGVCIDLLDEMDVPYNIVETNGTYDNIIDSIGNYDLIAGPLTVTKDRLEKTNFSQPFYVTSTTIAYTENAKPPFEWWNLVRTIINLFVVVLIISVIFWVVERKYNDGIENSAGGILTSFYWTTATMTTTGYGDITAKTKFGLFLSNKLMWVSIFLTAFLINAINDATEVPNVTLGDLNKCKVATIGGSTTAKFLEKNDIKYIQYDTPEEAFDAMNDGDLDAFVYDTPILKYLQDKDIYSDIMISDETFMQQSYGLAGDGFGELNPKILEVISSDEWEETLAKYNLN